MDDREPVFRLLALAVPGRAADTDQTDLQAVIREKDTLLRELQHRVTNNLQMITGLIRLESRTTRDDSTTESFDRLAGRIEALGLLYRSLSETADRTTIDLGIYLSENRLGGDARPRRRRHPSRPTGRYLASIG